MKLIIELSENDIYALSRDAKEGYDNPIDNVMLAVKNGTSLEDYCLTQCETGNPCLYCKHEFENKNIDKHIGDKCIADDCDECKNNYDCISYLEEHERINSENEIGD